ncbi:MAG TPA: tRNA (adenosine(37)-N6)-threonylcarbamoyltransferase complex dimerization subunit type 1 TsaB [Candidatus Saccharimonadales bacterium]|nr:tRNA (adenosine(37)-N6)-threonylcarbamoyltransferase complex dimerization subunit type 1 TsaB [Candidatus Saccharimonadales bacterium]
MILLLDTSTPVCKIMLVDSDWHYNDEWQADRTLARGLLNYLQEQLQKNGKTFTDISGIGVFRGPGSFTGLRIGLTVLNTMADSLAIPIVGGEGETWRDQVIIKLQSGQNDQIVLPLYGSDAHITKPRK